MAVVPHSCARFFDSPPLLYPSRELHLYVTGFAFSFVGATIAYQASPRYELSAVVRLAGFSLRRTTPLPAFPSFQDVCAQRALSKANAAARCFLLLLLLPPGCVARSSLRKWADGD